MNTLAEHIANGLQPGSRVVLASVKGVQPLNNVGTGESLWIGDVNDLFGVGRHCTTEHLFDRVAEIHPPAFEALPWQEAPRCDPAKVDEEALTMLHVLAWYGLIRPGDLLELDDGRTVFIGHVNIAGGICDSEMWGGEEFFERAVTRYKRG